MFFWVQFKLEKFGDIVIWEWVKLNKLGVFLRIKLIKVVGMDEKVEIIYKEISDFFKFECGKFIYDVFVRIFVELIFGCKFFLEWVIGKLDELDYMLGFEVVKKIIEFVLRFICLDVDKVEKIKGVDRVQNVRNVLDVLYNEWMK